MTLPAFVGRVSSRKSQNSGRVLSTTPPRGAMENARESDGRRIKHVVQSPYTSDVPGFARQNGRPVRREERVSAETIVKVHPLACDAIDVRPRRAGSVARPCQCAQELSSVYHEPALIALRPAAFV